MTTTPKSYLLTLFLESMRNPLTRDTVMTEAGSPADVTRFAHTRDENGEMAIITDKMNGPQNDGAIEAFKGAVLTDNALLVTLQDNIASAGTISEGEIDLLGQTYAAYLQKGDIQLSAMGDPALKRRRVIYLFVKDGPDAPYTAKVVTGKMDDYIVGDNGMALVYSNGKLATITAAHLANNLTLDTAVTLGAEKILAIGRDKQLARGPLMDIGGEKEATWAYVWENPEGIKMMTVLEKDTLEEIVTKAFTGQFATANKDGTEIIMVTHLEATDEGTGKKTEAFPVTRVPAAEFLQASAA